MSILDIGGPIPQGGVKNHVVVNCTRCGKPVMIPPGLVLRIPANPQGDFCHETADAKTGKSYRRG